MLCDSEKMGINQWPQRIVDRTLMPEPNPPTTTTNNNSISLKNSTNTTAPSPRGPMVQQQDQSAAAALKCPRCDSSNTKFCYYNNYSLSQPRHFCKACKRYWTRGGTLRNVPVGGGCRKNKRVKKSSSNSTASTASVTPTLDPPPPLSLPTQTSTCATTADFNSLFYNLPTTTAASSSDMNLAFPSLRSCAGYDLHPQLDPLGLGFPSNHSAGFGSNLAELHQSAGFLNDYQQFGSLLVSSLKQPKKSDNQEYQHLLPYEELQANGNLGLIKEVKVEGGYNVMGSSNSNRIEWQIPTENPFEAMNNASAASAAAGGNADHSSYLYWNTAVGSAGWTL